MLRLAAGSFTGSSGNLGDVLGQWMGPQARLSRACSLPGWPGVPGLLHNTKNSNNSVHPLGLITAIILPNRYNQAVRYMLFSPHFIDMETEVRRGEG